MFFLGIFTWLFLYLHSSLLFNTSRIQDLFVDYGDCSGGGAVLLWVALRALGGVWSACGSCGRVLMNAAVWSGEGIICLLPAAWLMTSADRNDFVPAQEKLEWVTPKISLMEAGDTEGKKSPNYSERANGANTYGLSWPFLHQTPPHQQNPITPMGLQRPFYCLPTLFP